MAGTWWHRLLATCAVATSVACAYLATTPRTFASDSVRTTPPLAEASSRFGTANVAPFLARVSKLIDSGFGPAECDPIVSFVGSMKVDDELLREFSVKFEGEEVEFRIHAVMGVHDSLRLSFFTAPSLAGTIRKEMAAFSGERDK
jgi:hypothetical protein